MRIKFVTVAYILFGIPVFSQNATLKGNVQLPDNTPVINAHIIIESLSKYTASDHKGNYILENIPYGKHILKVSSLEYGEMTIKVDITENPFIENIIINPSSNQLSEVVVNGQTKANKIETKGYAVNAIETKDISLQSIQANEILDQSAGIQVKQNGGLGSRLTYNINGLTGNAIRFFINGIPMDYFGASYSLNSIPASSIERIEVYKGVIPIEFGNDALGGAVNIVTKSKNKNELNASYSIGSFNTHQAALNGVWKAKKTGLSIGGNLFYNYSDNNYTVKGVEAYAGDPAIDGTEIIVDTKRFNDAYESYGGKLDFGFTDTSWADKLLVSLLYSDMYKEIQTGATMEVVYGERTYTSSTIAPNINYAKKDFLIKGLDVDVFGMYSDLTRIIIDTTSNEYDWKGLIVTSNPDLFEAGEAGNPTLNEDHEITYLNRLNLDYKINNKIKISTNYIRTDFNRESDDVLLPEQERALIDDKGAVKNILGLSLQTNKLIKNLTTSTFIKHYNLDVNALYRSTSFGGSVAQYFVENNYTNTGFGMALSYKLAKTIRLQLSGENSIRLPESQEIFGNSAQNIITNFNLRPEKSINLNFGANFGPFYFGEHSISLNSNVFYRNVTDMIRQANSVNEEDFAFENLLDVLSSGLDLDLKYNYKNALSINTTMSILNARFNTEFDESGARYNHYRDRLRNEPYLLSNTTGRYYIKNLFKTNSKTSFYYSLKYIHEYYRNWESNGSANKDTIPQQLAHDLGVSYTFPNQKLNISFDAKNIFDEILYDNFKLQKPGRAFYIKMNYTIK